MTCGLVENKRSFLSRLGADEYLHNQTLSNAHELVKNFEYTSKIRLCISYSILFSILQEKEAKIGFTLKVIC